LANAAVINQQLGGAIDPAGGSEMDFEATGSALLSTFNTLSGKVIQANWSGVGGTTGNTISNSAIGGVDVRIDHSPGFTASPNSATVYNSSGVGNGYQWTGEDGQQLTISFGTASGAQGQQFTQDRTVRAVGLMLLNFGGAYNTASDQTVTYYDSLNNVLDTQTFAGGADQDTTGAADFFTGYISSIPNIAYLTIDITRASGTSGIALDALTYVVPEPTSAALFGLGAFGLMLARRRR
jgi:hypothetical protein